METSAGKLASAVAAYVGRRIEIEVGPSQCGLRPRPVPPRKETIYTKPEMLEEVYELGQLCMKMIEIFDEVEAQAIEKCMVRLEKMRKGGERLTEYEQRVAREKALNVSCVEAPVKKMLPPWNPDLFDSD